MKYSHIILNIFFCFSLASCIVIEKDGGDGESSDDGAQICDDLGGETLSNDACAIRCEEHSDCPGDVECNSVWDVCGGPSSCGSAGLGEECDVEGWICRESCSVRGCYMPCSPETDPCPSGWTCTDDPCGEGGYACGWAGY